MPGIATVTGERASNHASETCAGVAPCRRGNRGGTALRAREEPLRERRPRDERRPFPLARREHGLGIALGEAEPVLDGRDGHDRPRPLELRRVDVRDGREPDLPLGTQLGERSERVLERHGRVDGVEIEEVDPLEPEPAQARLARRAQVLRPPVGAPALRALAA